MNRSLRVLLIGRHFWPHGSHDSAAALYQLAGGLARNNVHVEVVAPKHSVAWSDQCRLGGFVVRRPAVLPRRDWSFGRYTRHLASWLCQNASGFDLMIADAMREEAAAMVEAAATLGCVSVVTAGDAGPQSDLAWSGRTRTAKKTWSVAATADRILTISAAGHRGLIAAGCPPDKIVRRKIGFESIPPTTPERKAAARASLADANSDLKTGPDTPVILCVGRMTRESGLRTVTENAYWMLSRYPAAKLWLIGDGPAREAMHQDLKSDGVRSAIAMPGSFTTLADVYAAADLFVQADASGLGYFLPTAVAHELPVVVAESAEYRDLLSSAATQADDAVAWFSVPDRSGPVDVGGRASVNAGHKSFRDAVKRQMDRLEIAKSAARIHHRGLIRRSPYQAVLDQILGLGDQLAGATRTQRKAE